MGGNYIEFNIDRGAISRYGLNVADVQDVLEVAHGGMPLTTTVEGLERYPLNVRYPRELREDLPSLRRLLVSTPSGLHVPLGQVATLGITPGPPKIRSENAQRSAWVFVDIAGRDLGGYVADAKAAVNRAQVPLPPGYTRIWSGRLEYLEKAAARLRVVIPVTLALIVVLLYVSNGSWIRVGIVLLAVPFSLIGAFWFLWLLDYGTRGAGSRRGLDELVGC